MVASLGVSAATVRTHVQALMTKLGVHSQAGGGRIRRAARTAWTQSAQRDGGLASRHAS